MASILIFILFVGLCCSEYFAILPSRMLPAAGINHTYTVHILIVYGNVKVESRGIWAIRMVTKPFGNAYAVWASSSSNGVNLTEYTEYYSDGAFSTALVNENNCVPLPPQPKRSNCTMWTQVDSLTYKSRCVTNAADTTVTVYAQNMDPNSPSRITWLIKTPSLGTFNIIQEFFNKTESRPFPKVVLC